MKIRVGDLDELAPGKGKVVEILDREITVYNVDGRLRATSSRRVRASHHTGETDACAQHGLVFDAFAEDSPARLAADEESCAVRVEEGAVYVDV
jgi:nitrite reductase/ring-hydroxylating ferredoxin subunit